MTEAERDEEVRREIQMKDRDKNVTETRMCEREWRVWRMRERERLVRGGGLKMSGISGKLRKSGVTAD